MQLPNEGLSPEAHEAIIACLRIAAKRGKQLRLERERVSQTLQHSGSELSAMPDGVMRQEQSLTNPPGGPEESNSIQEQT